MTVVGLPAEFDWRTLIDQRVYRERKFRLYCCGGCRLLWDRLNTPEMRVAVETAERYADGEAQDYKLIQPYLALEKVASALFWKHYQAQRDGLASDEHRVLVQQIGATQAALGAALKPGLYFGVPTDFRGTSAHERTHLFRAFDAVRQALAADEQADCPERQGLWGDVFGNLFGTVPFDRSWRTATVSALARQMYESHDFGAMPILADALQDAGCDSDDILDHCRGQGPHVRGCWVVDLVLGKG